MAAPLSPASTPDLPAPPELAAPAGWQAVDFIADLHLQADEPATFAAWRRYMRDTPADALFILGDLFEAWVGDDAATAGRFEARCAEVLLAATARRPVYFMRGNRDFLVGPAFLNHCRVHDLADPSVLVFGGARWLLSHGDALCLDDTAYQQFRQQVRQPAWQQAFLARPLAERDAIARQMRQHSQARQQGQPPETHADVDAPAACAWLRQAGCATLIHGHTHRPADHALGEGLARLVLSDWHLDGPAPRAEVLRLTRHGPVRLPLADAA